MKLTSIQFDKLSALEPKLTKVTLNGTTDYTVVTDLLGKPLLTAIASKIDQPLNELVWAIIRHISESVKLTAKQTTLVDSF